MYNFKQFTNVGSSYASKISIRQNGSIGFSQGALRKFSLEEGEFFIGLFFDAQAKVIGLKPLKEEAEGLVRLQRRPVTSSGKTTLTAQISVRSFLDYYQIPYRGKKQSFEPSWSDEHQMILIDLNKPREAGGEDDVE